MKSIAPLVTTLLLALPAQAQQDAVFDSYDAMRGEMEALVKSREIEDLMIRFGGADEMTIEQLRSLDAQVEQLYPQDFEQSTLLRKVSHGGGFHQELWAYWTGTAYLFVYVFYHQTNTAAVAINFRFNSDFVKLNSLF